MDLAGRERRGERLGVQPGEHQHAAVGDVLDDRRDEAVGRRTGRPPGRATSRPSRRGHPATPRTGRPAAAIAALTSAIEWIRRWKIDGREDRIGAAVADRRDEVVPGPAAPPDAMTGTRDTRS